MIKLSKKPNVLKSLPTNIQVSLTFTLLHINIIFFKINCYIAQKISTIVSVIIFERLANH